MQQNAWGHWSSNGNFFQANLPIHSSPSLPTQWESLAVCENYARQWRSYQQSELTWEACSHYQPIRSPKKYSGDLLIVASGPSVNETDFAPLQSLPAMGVNGSWFLNDKINFNFFVIVDMTFIDQRLSMVEEVISDPDLLFFTTVHGIVKIIDRFGQSAIRCQVAIIEDACVKIFQPKVSNNEIPLHWQHDKSVSFWEKTEALLLIMIFAKAFSTLLP